MMFNFDRCIAQPCACRLFVRLAAVLSDYRGLQELTRMKGSPSHWACFKCWISGFMAGAGKRLYTLHYTFLPLGHFMRSVSFGLFRKHNLSKQKRTGKELPPRRRTLIELMFNIIVPPSLVRLVAGEPPSERNGEQGLLAENSNTCFTCCTSLALLHRSPMSHIARQHCAFTTPWVGLW